MSRRVAVRDDRRISDSEQLLVRMNDDRDVANALKLALADAPAYRVVPGFELSGALAVSCFAVADEIEAQIVVRGTRWSWYGLSRVSDLRALRCQLVATNGFAGDDVLVADSGTGPFKATIMNIDADGTLVLAVHAFIPAHA